MTERITCCVPFCRRSSPRSDFREFICARHWPLVPRRDRMIYLRRRRAALRSPERWDRYVVATDRLWARMKRMAIERAAGL